MKKMMTVTFILLALNSFASSTDVAHEYQKALDVYQLENNKVRAKVMLEDLLAEVNQEDALFSDIYNTYLEVMDIKEREGLDKAIKFVTGKKEETFCKNVGLVYAHYFHNDGTVSELILTENKRKVEEGSYSIVTGGSWKYQLDTEYREPIESELWSNSGDRSSYDVREARKNGDKGSWNQHFKPGSYFGNSSTRGQTKEPLPMFMSYDFQVWGTPDAGHVIDFRVGAQDTVNAGENTFVNGRINLSSTRIVAKKLPKFEKKDFDKKLHQYSDCFQVNTVIKFSSINPKARTGSKDK